MEKKTPLYQSHQDAGGKIVPFAGYLLPVQYQDGIIAEHMRVRNQVGMFDVSHMGEVILEGAGSLAFLNYVMTNDFSSMKVGGCRYTLMLYPDGGQVDDLIVYRMGEEKFLLVLNASNTDKDVSWLQSHLPDDCTLTNISDDIAQIAVQGPQSKEAMSHLCNPDVLPKKYYTFVESMEVAGVEALVSRTGYTGEFGYEIYLPAQQAKVVWDALLSAGVKPCGLGARDTLRLEAAMPLYGHELSDAIHVNSTQLGFAIKANKADFIGKSAIQNPPVDLPLRVGLKVTGRGIVRGDEPVLLDGQPVGFTTSGTHCPYLGSAYAMAYVAPHVAQVGTELVVTVRGRAVEVAVVALPFYKN